jgi:hypothetical protein
MKDKLNSEIQMVMRISRELNTISRSILNKSDSNPVRYSIKNSQKAIKRLLEQLTNENLKS